MRRMNERMEEAYLEYNWVTWRGKFARLQWKYILHICNAPGNLWAKRLCKFNYQIIPDPLCTKQPHRLAGRPKSKWDDHIQKFCNEHFSHLIGMHWMDIFSQTNGKFYEDAYVNFRGGNNYNYFDD